MSGENFELENLKENQYVRSLLEHFHRCQTSNFRDRTITINARGFKYQILKDNLLKYPDTRLGKLIRYIEMKSLSEIASLCDGYDLSLNEFYFDQDPFMLNMVLNFYQSGKLHLSHHSECNLFVQRELNYWQISEFSLDSCCEFTYFENLEEIRSLIATEESVIKRLSHKDYFGTRFFPKFRENIWNLFAKIESSIYAKILYFFSVFMIVLSIISFVIQSIPGSFTQSNTNTKTTGDQVLYIIETICVVWLVFESLIRLIFSPNKRQFMKHPANIIDIVGTTIYLVRYILMNCNVTSTFEKILNTLRILLMFKMVRHSSSLKSFIKTMQKSSKELIVLLVFLLIGMMFFSTILYYCEYGNNPAFDSIPAALWWAVITMTTIGYGDVTPSTTSGKIFGGICAVSGIFILSLPIGIISSNFSQIIEKQRTIVRIEKNKLKKQHLKSGC